MNKSPATLAVGLAVILLFVFASHSSANPPTAGTQDAEYAYDVLPGLHSDQATPVDLGATQGWHSSPLAIDMVPTSGGAVGSTTFASFLPVTPSSNIAARVALAVRSGPGCRAVHVQLYRKDSGEIIGTVIYTHVLPDVRQGDAIPLSAGASTPLGTLAEAAWVSVSWNTDDLGQAIDAEIQARLNDVGSGFTADGVRTVGSIQHVTVNRVRYAVRQMFGWQESGGRSQGWYEQRWRNAAPPGNADGATCPSTGAHLHQAASASSAVPSGLQLNRDNTDNLDDDGFGFPAGQLSWLRFCSDTWVFRLQSSQTAPLASPVQPCGAPSAAPANLTAAAGDRRIALHWDDPNDATITEYEIRRRLSNASLTTASPWTAWATIRGSGAGTTSHTVPQLNNETAYTLQIRAVNANGYGPAGTASATPTVTVPSAAPDLTLTTLALSGASLTFDSATTSYAVTVDDDLSRTTLTATPNNSNASLTITPGDANPDTDAHEVDLAVGVTTITIEVAHLGETRSYTVTVTRPDPLVAPVVTSFRASSTTLTGNFTWSGSSPRFLRWTLYQANSEGGAYSAIGSAVEDSRTPVRFSGQTRDRWYRLRGRTCEHRTAVGAQGANAGSRQATQLVTVCGVWSAYSEVAEIEESEQPDEPERPTCTPDNSIKPSTTQTVTSTETRWTMVGVYEYKEQRTKSQRQTRSVSWECEARRWTSGTWGDSGSPTYDSWSATGDERCKEPYAAKPAETKTETVTEYRWVLRGATAHQQKRTGTAHYSRTVTKTGPRTCDWTLGGWGSPDRTTWGTWADTGTSEARPASSETEDRGNGTATRWIVGSSSACEEIEQLQRRRTRSVRFSASSGWTTGSWSTWGAPYRVGWTRTGSCLTKPVDDVVQVRQWGVTETDWERESSVVICIDHQVSRRSYRFAYYLRPHVWSSTATAWVDGQRNAAPYFTEPYYSRWTLWERTGVFRLCPQQSQSAGGQSQTSDLRPAQLAAGDYKLQWGDSLIGFTVPTGATVELRNRRLDSGEDAAVFSVAGGAELVVTPAMLAEDAVSGLAAVSDPTLASLSASLDLAQADSAQPTAATETACVEAAKPESGAANVDLADATCVIVRGGGAVEVSDGTRTLNLTLSAERDWLALAGPHSADSDADAFWFLDLTSGGWVALDPADGAELARYAPVDAEGVSALLDAVGASAFVPPATE